MKGRQGRRHGKDAADKTPVESTRDAIRQINYCMLRAIFAAIPALRFAGSQGRWSLLGVHTLALAGR